MKSIINEGQYTTSIIKSIQILNLMYTVIFSHFTKGMPNMFKKKRIILSLLFSVCITEMNLMYNLCIMV